MKHTNLYPGAVNSVVLERGDEVSCKAIRVGDDIRTDSMLITVRSADGTTVEIAVRKEHWPRVLATINRGSGSTVVGEAPKPFVRRSAA